EAKEVFEEVIAPLRGSRCPCTFKATRDSISAVAISVGVFPAEALFFDPCCGGFRANVCGTGGAVGFSKAVSAGDKGYGFFVVRRHASERFPDVARSC